MQGIGSLRLVARNANNVIRRNYGHGRKHPFPTINSMPVPEGDFFALHAKRNRKYNAILAAGITMFSTGVYILSTDTIVRFHWHPPSSIE